MDESVTDCPLQTMLKNPDDHVGAEKPIAQIETNKVTIAVSSPEAGINQKEMEMVLSSVSVVECSDQISGTRMDSTLELPVKPLKKPELTNEERLALYRYLLEQSDEGKLKYGSIQAAASKYSVSTRTVSRIWHQAKNSEHGHVVYSIPDLSSKRKGRVGPKKVDLDLNRINQIPLRQRTNIRSLASALNVPKSTLHARIKEGLVRTHSNAMKPRLSFENKKARLQFCISMLKPVGMPFFQDMYNYVHVDVARVSEKYYLLPEEDDPGVMFLAVIARPRFDTMGNVLFDGKIGIFPFHNHEAAKQSSNNLPDGTMETHSMLSVTKKMMKDCLISKVLPAIKSKWPYRGEYQGPIYIQQDSAKLHISPDDPDFVKAAAEDGFDVRLICQPLNSPDLSVLELGFFRSIQTLQHQQAPTSIDELVGAVHKVFDEFPATKLNQNFLCLQQCMTEIMKVGGGNNYKLPHLGKGKLDRKGMLSTHLLVEGDIVQRTMEDQQLIVFGQTLEGNGRGESDQVHINSEFWSFQSP